MNDKRRATIFGIHLSLPGPCPDRSLESRHRTALSLSPTASSTDTFLIFLLWRHTARTTLLTLFYQIGSPPERAV
jgi:hypothetical protein